MINDYNQLILQFDLSIIYWLAKYQLIETNDILNKLILTLDTQDSTTISDFYPNNTDIVAYFNNNSPNEFFKVKIFQSIVEKWMSIVSDWQISDFKLTKSDYSNVKTSIGRIPKGLIGLCGDIALVSPFIHQLDIDFESNRSINGGLVPFINYLNNSAISADEAHWISDEIHSLFLADAEAIWRKVKNFIQKNKSDLSHYSSVDYYEVNKYINNAQFTNVKLLLPHLKPFPTICYIVGPDTNKKISKLEQEGYIAKYQTLLDSDEKLMDKFINEHFHCLISRFRLLHIDLIRYLYTLLVSSSGFRVMISEILNYDISESDKVNTSKSHDESNENMDIIKTFNILNTIRRYGIGGTENWYRVKCLHSHYAYTMSFGLRDLVTQNYINSII